MILLQITIIVLLLALIFCVLKITALEKTVMSYVKCLTGLAGVLAGHKKTIDNLIVVTVSLVEKAK